MSAAVPPTTPRLVLPDVVEEHAEEAAFLWMLRDAAARSADYTLEELAELDDRLDAHLEGLRVSGAAGRKIWAETLAAEETSPGADFARGVLALQEGDAVAWRALLDEARDDPARERELISALGWSSLDTVEPRLRDMLADPALDPGGIALRGLAVHRQDPGPPLAASLGAESRPCDSRRVARSCSSGTDGEPRPWRRTWLSPAPSPRRRPSTRTGCWIPIGSTSESGRRPPTRQCGAR
jgi:uncharacterized protein (TIGR02270 family)